MDLIVPSTNVIADALGGVGGGRFSVLKRGSEMAGYAREKYWFVSKHMK